MKLGTPGFSSVLVLKIASILTGSHFMRVYSEFYGPLPIYPKNVIIESYDPILANFDMFSLWPEHD